MKKWILYTSLIGMLLSCQQEGFNTSVQPDIKISSETKYKIVESDQTKVYTKDFSNEGKLLKFTRFQNEDTSQVSEFDYIEGVKVEKVTDYAGESKSVETIEYYQNSNGQVNEIIRFDLNGNVIENEFLEYDNFGRLSKRIGSGDSLDIINYDYVTDELGRVNSIVVLDQFNKQIKYDSLVYDTDELTRISINNEGEIERKVVVIYNRAGNLEQEIVYNELNEITCRFLYSYTFFE